MITRLTERLTPMFEKAFAKAEGTRIPAAEDWCWELTTAMHHELGTCLYASLQAPSSVLGSIASSGLIIPAPSTLTDQSVEGLVDQLIEGINAQRSAALDAAPTMNGAAATAGSLLDIGRG